VECVGGGGGGGGDGGGVRSRGTFRSQKRREGILPKGSRRKKKSYRAPFDLEGVKNQGKVLLFSQT